MEINRQVVVLGKMANPHVAEEGMMAPLLKQGRPAVNGGLHPSTHQKSRDHQVEEPEEAALLQQTWMELKKLWAIVGPTIFTRLAMYGMYVVTQAIVGHLGDLQLAALSIALTVIVGFNYGFLVYFILSISAATLNTLI
uniref:Protein DETOXIFICATION n=1 Tax=Nymphaea colorata TaxID=210225 RepID=A0A5K1FR04_9MAGN